MTSTMQQFNVSGNMIEGGVTGSATFNLTLLCGVANGSVIVPLTISGNGTLLS